MAALVKAEDVGDRDKHHCVEEAGAAGNLQQHLCSLPSSRSAGEPWALGCPWGRGAWAGLALRPSPKPPLLFCRRQAHGEPRGSVPAVLPCGTRSERSSSGVLGRRGGKQSKAEPVALEERKGVKLEPRAGTRGREEGQCPARLPHSACPFPARGRRRGPSRIPLACPGPRRGVKSRVVPGIMILL